MTTHHNPPGVYPKYLGYSHAVEVAAGSRMLFISGINGYLEDRKTMPEMFEDQSRIIWGHFRTILQSAGMDYRNIIFLRTYLADPEDRVADARLRKEHLGDHEVGLTVICATLLVPSWKVEMEAVAAG